jgi:hypothetical protein
MIRFSGPQLAGAPPLLSLSRSPATVSKRNDRNRTMACRGVLFAIDRETADTLRAIDSDAARVEYIQEVIEEDYFANHNEWLAETDKSWDWIHRALTDGELGWDNGPYPLNHVIMGGESLHDGSEYIITLKTPQQVADVAAALSSITEESFAEGFRQIDESELNGGFEEDFGYTWDYFNEVRDFWLRAARLGRFVIFTVDQ